MVINAVPALNTVMLSLGLGFGLKAPRGHFVVLVLRLVVLVLILYSGLVYMWLKQILTQ